MKALLLLPVLCALASTCAVAQQPPASNTSAATESAKPAIAAPDLPPGANGSLSQEQMQQLFRVVAEKDEENNKKERDYTYLEREVESKLDPKGEAKSTETKTYDVLEIYGE